MLLLLYFLGVPVEEHVNHDIPTVACSGDGSTESEDFTGKEPPYETDGVLGLVVRGDGDINEFSGGVGVAESNDGDVNV